MGHLVGRSTTPLTHRLRAAISDQASEQESYHASARQGNPTHGSPLISFFCLGTSGQGSRFLMGTSPTDWARNTESRRVSVWPRGAARASRAATACEAALRKRRSPEVCSSSRHSNLGGCGSNKRVLEMSHLGGIMSHLGGIRNVSCRGFSNCARAELWAKVRDGMKE